MTDRPDDPLAFFGGSTTRLIALEALCEGAMTKAELLAQLDTSRITLWRILSDLEEQGWVRETRSGFVATAAGRIVVERIRAMQDALADVTSLGDLLDWLPLAEMDFPIERLADAEIVRPTTSDPQGPMRLATRQIEAATTIRILTHGYSPWVIEIMHELGMAGEQTSEIVTSPDVLEAFLNASASRIQLRELIEAGCLEYFQYDGAVPHIFVILDDERVGMGIDDDEGRPQATLDIEDSEVLAWANRTFGRYRSSARRVDPSRFSE